MANLIGARIERKEDKKFLTGKSEIQIVITLSHYQIVFYLIL